MAVTYTFVDGAPVKAGQVNQNFIDVEDAIEVVSSTTGGDIEALQDALNDITIKANNSMQLTGDQTIRGVKTFTGTVKVPNSSKAGTALANTECDVGASGFEKTGNKKMMQWGYADIVNKGAITMPKPFASANAYKVALLHVGTSNNALSLYEDNSHNRTASKFYVATGTSSTLRVWYIAIGQWS